MSTEIQSTEVVHDAFGLSKAEQWVNCPGSVNRAKGVTPPESGAMTNRGTILHQLAEGIHNGIPVASVACPEGTDPAEWAKLQIVAGAMYDAAIAEIDALLMPGYEIVVEVKVALDHLGIEKPGYLDIRAFGIAATGPLCGIAQLVVVVDYKTGRIQVEAEGNMQIAGYCTGAARELGADLAVGIVVQPIDEEGDKVVVRKVQLDADELDAWTYYLKRARIIAGFSNALVVGDHCTYCNARMVCEARRSILSQKIDLPSLEKWLDASTKEQRGEFYGQIVQGIKWAEGAKEAVQAYLQTTGLEAAGWKWKKGASIRVWADSDAVRKEFENLIETVGIPREAFFEVKLKSPKTLETEGAISPEIYQSHVGTRENAMSLMAVKGAK
jgi:hypothetical protein